MVRQNLANAVQVFHLGTRQNPHPPTTFGPFRMMCCSYCPNLGAGIATRYVLNASGFELLEVIIFFPPHPSITILGPTQAGRDAAFFAEGKTA